MTAASFTPRQEDRIIALAVQLSELPANSDLGINIESFASNKATVASERSILAAAIALSGESFKIETIPGYALRARRVS